jgi:flagella basal body P-ring formation protein FlgA
MMRLLLAMICAAGPALGSAVVPTRTIPARTVLTETDLALADINTPGTISDIAMVLGLETRVALYQGRPFALSDLAAPALVERNQLINIVFRAGGLFIAAEGRSLDRAAPGERLRVMNLSSRATVSARLGADGVAYVGY